MNPATISSENSNSRMDTMSSNSRWGVVKKGYFEIRSLEWLTQNNLLPSDQQDRLQWYEITWFKAGAGEVVIDSKIHEIKKNAVYCLAPGQIRAYHLKGEAHGYQLSFSNDFIQMNTANSRISSWLDSYSSGTHPVVMETDPDMQNEMEAVILKMQHEFMNYYLLRAEILSGLLNILMIYFSRKLQVSANELSCSKDTDLVRRFKKLLKKDFASKKQVSDYASELCVTPNYLNRTVKKVTGSTASYHIQQHIILEAKRQAVHSNVSMKEIAYFLGFDNLAHFSKFFKNNSGMNFTSFKKELLYAG